MDHFSIIMSLIGGIFVSIIGVYVWTFRVYRSMQEQMGKVYSLMHKHIENAAIHAEDTYTRSLQNDDKTFVRMEVCNAIQKSVDTTLNSIHDKVNILLAKAE